MRLILQSVIFPVSFCLLALTCGGTSQPPEPTGWTLTWSDEFSGTNGSAADAAKWTLETGGNGWGNNELEYYTDRLQNAQQRDGNLVITVQKETFTGTDGVTRNYTSARLKTARHFTQTYGRFEARIKVPKGRGIWPAFWMLGDNIDIVGWPTCGEIDIMENIGSELDKVHGSMHGPGYFGNTPLTAVYTLASGQFGDDSHVFAIEWEPAAVRFYVDGNLYQTRTPSDLPTGTRWVFDHPFFILLNVAVGGNFPGDPDASSTFPQTMLVDYVRVYARK
ncbi:MAG: glycoside hydrolase family 16 protein [Acidobacteriia bacterium]|nr:glycoside hydrolase family 16 protein [Terriglobia bacterium]